jgi:hypothetical protein
MTKHVALLALATAALAACEQTRSTTAPAPTASIATALDAQPAADAAGGRRAVYTLTNQVAGNAVGSSIAPPMAQQRNPFAVMFAGPG